MWLIRSHLSNRPVLARRFCYLAERKIGTQDEVALKYIRRLSSNDGRPPQETADEWTERSWEPNPIITALLTRAAQLPELKTAIMKKRYQKNLTHREWECYEEHVAAAEAQHKTEVEATMFRRLRNCSMELLEDLDTYGTT